MTNHLILCGLGRVGQRVLDYLVAAGIDTVVIDNKASPKTDSSPSVQFLCGDFRRPELLDQAGLAHARGVLILSSDDLANLSALMAVVKERPGLRVVVRMFNPTLVTRLGDVATNVFALSTSALTAPMFALAGHTHAALADFTLDDGRAMSISEWTIPEGHPWLGRPLAGAFADAGVQLVHRTRGNDHHLFRDIPHESFISSRDRFIVCGPTPRIETMLGTNDVEVFGLRWSRLRRLGRTARRIVTEIDLPVKVCTAVLFAVIFTSMLVFYFGMKNDSLIDAFYRTISLMATGADMRGQDVDPGSWQKGFISVLRLLGTALTAAFTAILTNYLVRAHLGGALEVRRIPDAGHVIVTGLGNIGFRVVESLLRLGDPVVAIERQRDNPFIATARRLGAAVIIGDATVQEVLRQAHASTAKAILATTQNDLTNLEIALLARELHPRKRIVVRLTDTQLAQLLREAANIRLALSVPELAAPAILSTFLGDRIRAVLIAEGQLLAVLDLVIKPSDPWAGARVHELATRFDLLPIAAPGHDVLSPGYSVTAIATFRGLGELFRREFGR